MDEHKGDLAGFAKQEGFASVHPSMKDTGRRFSWRVAPRPSAPTLRLHPERMGKVSNT